MNGLVYLFGHRKTVNDISSSLEFGIFVSASDDKTCIIWNLRKPKYVKSVKTEFPAKQVCVSPTSGDFVVCSSPPVENNFSALALFTINGNLVSSQKCEPPVDSITFSSSPEGIAVNVIATGHRTTGVVRLWSSWDLTPVRDIDTKLPNYPIIALSFSFDNLNLFAATSNGDVVIFEKENVSEMQRPPKYLDLTEM
jgi:WD40 repeat protein